jgi:hypothetical protein
MDTHTQVPQRVFVDLLGGLSAASSMMRRTMRMSHARKKKRAEVDGVSARGLHQNDDPNGMGCDYLIESYMP